MAHFIETFKRGQEGESYGRTTGIPALDSAIHGLQKRMIIGLAAAAKCGKCLGVGTKVIMYDLSKKKVEDLIVGDILLGVDGKPNKITSLAKGKEMMYWIHQSKAMSYRVNESHILSLKNSDETVKNISIKEYFNQSYKVKRYSSYGYKSSIIRKDKEDLEIDPYFLGLWLGDGTSANSNITCASTEIIAWLVNYCNSISHSFKIKDKITWALSAIDTYFICKDGIITTASSSVEASKITGILTEYISRGLVKKDIFEKDGYTITRRKITPIQTHLSKLSLLNNKHIPLKYLNTSESNRLQLLAGIIDTDGYLPPKKTSFEVVQKNKTLAEDIVTLANTLGFSTKIIPKIATMNREDGSIYKCKVYRITIKGEVANIPVKVGYKMAKAKTKSPHSTIEVIKDKVDNYYGFTLENKDKRFYLEDFTVTHNTTLNDFAFILSPYLEAIEKGTLDDIEWIYFSYEIDRVSKEFKFAAFFMAHDYEVYNFMYKDKLIKMSSDYLQGKERYKNPDGTYEMIPINPEHEKMLKTIYLERIVPLFGEYTTEGKLVKKGKILFFEERENPTGLYKFIRNFAEANGKFIKEAYTTAEGGRERIIGYTPNNPKRLTVVITDHIRRLKKERGFSMKDTIDKWLEYSTDLKNWCGYTFIHIAHSNRNLANPDRLKFAGEFIFPTGDDTKDSGNFAEDCTVLMTLFNPNDEKYNLTKHFGVELAQYPFYRSLHITESRFTDCPAHIQMNMFGGINTFTPLNQT